MEAITTINPAGGRRDALKQLEDELSKSLGSFSPKSSLDGVLAPQYRPPPAPAVPTKRLQQELERRKNWGFGDSENPGPTLPDGNPFRMDDTSANKQPKKAPTSDKFYDRLFQQREDGLANGLNPEDDPTRRRNPSTPREDKDTDENMPSALKSRVNQLKDLVGSDSHESVFSTGAARSSFSDFFGLGPQQVTPQREQARKDYMDKFQKVLDESSTPAVVGLAPNPLSGNESPRKPGYTGGLEERSGAGSSSTVGGGPGGLNSFLNAGTLPDHNASVLNLWNPLYSTPKVDPPKPAPPLSIPTLEVPRRKF